MSSYSDESSYVDYMNQKNIKFSHNGHSRCDDCEMFIPSHSIAEHMEFHKRNQSEFDDPEYSTVYSLKNRYEKIDALVRQPFREVDPNRSRSGRGSRASHASHNGSIGTESVKVDNYGSGSVDKASDANAADWFNVPTVENNVNHSRMKLELPNVASLELNEAAAAIKKLPREARPSVRMAKAAAAKKTPIVNGNGVVLKATPDLPTKKPSVDALAMQNSQAKTMTPKKKSVHRSSSQMRPQEMPPLIKAPRREKSVEVDRPKVPTVFEMFNIRRHEMRGPTSEYETEDEHLPRKPTASGKQNIPMSSIQCPLCLNLMHKNDFKAHLMRKHYDGNCTLDVESDEPSKCEICGNFMPLEHIQAHIDRTHGNAAVAGKNKDQFVRCNFCSAYMHIDYMPGHLFRKHKSHEGSIGVIWPQYTDEQACQWFNDGSKIYIKNGAMYIARDEDEC